MKTTFRALTVLAVSVTLLAACSRDPMGTKLPLDLKDIPTIQPQLDKLAAEDRELVLEYLQRSKGDVLPPKFADPDAPLTARTFREAIKLQKEYRVKFAEGEKRVEGLRAEREAGFDALREVVSVTLLNREIMTADEAMGRQPQPGVALNNNETLVVTFRLQNRSAETVEKLQGSIKVRTSADPKSLMGVVDCWIDRREPIQGSMSVEVRCGDPRKTVGQATRDFVALPESDLILSWEPKRIELSNGKVLTSE